MSTRSKRSAAGSHHDLATPVKVAKLTNGTAAESKGKQKAGESKASAHALTGTELYTAEAPRPSVRSLLSSSSSSSSSSPLPYGPAPESSAVAKAWLEEHGNRSSQHHVQSPVDLWSSV